MTYSDGCHHKNVPHFFHDLATVHAHSSSHIAASYAAVSFAAESTAADSFGWTALVHLAVCFDFATVGDSLVEEPAAQRI
jgi:hypothetical protein